MCPNGSVGGALGKASCELDRGGRAGGVVVSAGGRVRRVIMGTDQHDFGWPCRAVALGHDIACAFGRLDLLEREFVAEALQLLGQVRLGPAELLGVGVISPRVIGSLTEL